MLFEDKIPLEHRKMLLADLCQNGTPEADTTLESILRAAAGSEAGLKLLRHRKKELDGLLEALRDGPLRCATFVRSTSSNGGPKRALVRMPDGTSVYTVVNDEALSGALRRGDAVLLSGRGEMIVAREEPGAETGEEARLEAWLGDRVEVSLRGDERYVLDTTDALRRRLEEGTLPPGSPLLVCLRRGMALEAVARPADELARFMYLAREPVPDVVAERDIGDPPPFLGRVREICRQEMLDPGRRRRYGLRRCATFLLTGTSGSGKTLCVSACIRTAYEVMAEATGIEIDRLPPRVIRLRASKLLSEWLGRSDKNADRLVDEIVELADTPLSLPDGRSVELPVLVVLEEFDGVARRRGLDHDGVHDRIQTTLLQRLDHTTNRALRERLIFIFATTNVPGLIDPAWLRRVGGQVIHFGRLRRGGFLSVLEKHLRGRPLAGGAAQVAADVAASLYSANGSDRPLVEVQLAGTSAPRLVHRRDFLTGSIVDRAVQQAAEEACRAEEAGDSSGAGGGGGSGITARLLLGAIGAQVEALARSLTPANVAEFCDLPEGMRVANVRRLEQPAVAAWELEPD
jgi:ATP-dependent 26S proteasome regulatory subunit